MLGQPPKYSTKAGDEESLPLKHHGAFADEEDELDRVPTPTYPPRQQCGPSSAVQVNVRYTFNPRWPIKGKSEDALGVLGSDKQATIEMVQRIFPTLASFPAHRLEFLVPIAAETANDKPQNGPNNWCRVLDEAWNGFANDPPQRLIVQVADLPGQAKQRDRRVLRRQISVFAFVLLSPFLIIGFAALGVYLSDKEAESI